MTPAGLLRRHASALAPAASAVFAPGLAVAQVNAPGAYHASEILSAGGILQVVTGLALVVALIFGVAWFARRFGRFQSVASEQLRLLGGIHVGQREKIVIVQAGDERLVVGVSPGCIRTLHVLSGAAVTDEGEFPAAPRGPQGFLERLNQELRKRIRP